VIVVVVSGTTGAGAGADDAGGEGGVMSRSAGVTLMDFGSVLTVGCLGRRRKRGMRSMVGALFRGWGVVVDNEAERIGMGGGLAGCLKARLASVGGVLRGTRMVPAEQKMWRRKGMNNEMKGEFGSRQGSTWRKARGGSL